MKTPFRPATGLAIACCMALAPAAAWAETFVVDFNNVYSADVRGSSDNSTLTFQLGAGAYITAFSWNVDVTAYAPSWLSDLTLEFTNSWGVGVQFSPVDSTDAPGTATDSGSVNLVNSGLGLTLRPDGLLQLSFYDFYDDLPDAPDGRWNSGTLSFTYTPATVVPEPASYALLGLGLLAVGALRLRRSQTTG